MFNRTTAERLSDTTICVVVGASECRAPGLKPLPAAATESEQIAQALQATDGLAIPDKNVSCLTGQDACASAVRTALEAARSAVRPETTLVFYFAGHGVELGETAFGLCLADTVSTTASDSMLTSTYLENLFRGCPATGILFILDCCGGAGMAERAPAMFSAVGESEFRILLSASRRSQSSWETAEGSFFTTFLLKAFGGQVTLGEDPGSLFFNDLYTYLHDSVLEMGETKYPGLPRQEPVFSGTYVRDPLLFVHGKLSRAQLVVRTRRYSKEYMRRLLRRWAVASITTTLVAIGSYWAYLDQHQFAQLTEAGIEIWHGRNPTLQGFGLPHRVWTFDVGRDEVSSQSSLARGAPIVSRAGESVLDLVPDQLNDLGRARWLWSSGNRQDARLLLRQAIDGLNERTPEERARAVQLLAAFGEADDAKRLVRAMPLVPLDYQRDVVRGVVRLGQAAGFASLLNGDAGDAGRKLTSEAITELKAECTVSLQEDISRFGKLYAKQDDLPRLYFVATATGCKIPLTLLGRASPAYAEVVAAHIESAYPDDRANIVESLTKMLEATAAGKYEQSRVLTQMRLLSLLAKGRCPAVHSFAWLDPAWGLQLSVAQILTQACEGWRARVVTTEEGHYELQLLRTGRDRPELVVDVTQATHRGVTLMDLLQMFRRSPIEGDTDVLLDIIRHSTDELSCRTAMQTLYARGIAPPPEVPRFFNTTYTPLMTVALVYWGTAHREDTLRVIAGRMSDPAATFIPGTLAHLTLSIEEREQILRAAASDRSPTERKANLLGMLGDRESIVRILCSPDPALRKGGFATVGLREDLDQLMQPSMTSECHHTNIRTALQSVNETKTELARFIDSGPQKFRALRTNIALFYHPTHDEGLRTWLRRQCLDCE